MGCGQSKIGIIYPRKSKNKNAEKKAAAEQESDEEAEEGEKGGAGDANGQKLPAVRGRQTVSSGPLLAQAEISNSQMDFFRMLDEKIENGPDYDCEADYENERERIDQLLKEWESRITRPEKTLPKHISRYSKSMSPGTTPTPSPSPSLSFNSAGPSSLERQSSQWATQLHPSYRDHRQDWSTFQSPPLHFNSPQKGSILSTSANATSGSLHSRVNPGGHFLQRSQSTASSAPAAGGTFLHRSMSTTSYVPPSSGGSHLTSSLKSNHHASDSQQQPIHMNGNVLVDETPSSTKAVNSKVSNPNFSKVTSDSPRHESVKASFSDRTSTGYSVKQNGSDNIKSVKSNNPYSGQQVSNKLLMSNPRGVQEMRGPLALTAASSIGTKRAAFARPGSSSLSMSVSPLTSTTPSIQSLPKSLSVDITSKRESDVTVVSSLKSDPTSSPKSVPPLRRTVAATPSLVSAKTMCLPNQQTTTHQNNHASESERKQV